MKKIGYIRVSTQEQNTDRQEISLDSIGMDRKFMEKASGINTDRPELKKMLDYVREGDTIYVESISRLARSTKDFLEIIEHLKLKEVSFISLKEKIDTTTSQGKFMLTVFAALAELERDSIHQRQAEGISAAKQKGKHLGRPKAQLPANWKQIYNSWKASEITAVKAMEELKMTKTLFYKMASQYESQS